MKGQKSSTTLSASEMVTNAATALNAGELLSLCEKLVASYNSAKINPDIHADECIAEWKVTDEDDKVFLKQVLYGCCRYKKLIKALVTSLYHNNSGCTLRSDVHLYSVFVYLILIRLEELTFEQFRRLCLTQEPQKILVLVNYVFNRENLEQWCKDEWLKIYDTTFVTALIDSVLQWQPHVAEMVKRLEEKVFMKRRAEEQEADTGARGASSKFTATVVQPFNLSMSKRKPVYIDEEPVVTLKARPPPPHLDGPTPTELALEKAREQNRARAAEKYADARPFRLRVLERPSNLEKVKLEVEETRAEAHAFRPVKARPVPAASEAKVKYNAAAILREDALLRKKQEEAAKALQQYESELRDASEYLAWREEMSKAEEAERAAEIERRRIETAAGAEMVKQAVAAKAQENKQTVASMRAQAELLEQQLAQEREQIEQANRMKKLEIVEDRQAVKAAVEKVAAEKRRQAEEVERESAARARRLAEEKAIEQKRKEDLIRQLRALDAVQRTRSKEPFDPFTSGNHGLLEEMSLAELKERVGRMREQERAWEEEQRARIAAQKQEKESALLSKAETISKARERAEALRKAKRAARAVEARAKEEEGERARQEGEVKLAERLQAKRRAREEELARLEAEERAIAFEQQRLAAEKARLDALRAAELGKGAERAARAEEERQRKAAETEAETKAKQERLRKQLQRAERTERKRTIKHYDAKVERIKAENVQEKTEELAKKKTLVLTERQRMEHARQALTERDPYKASLTLPLRERPKSPPTSKMR